MDWLNEDDKNTKFYHCMANGRKRRNWIDELTIEGNVVSDPIQLSSGVFNFFKKHFQKEQWTRPRLPLLQLKRITDMEKSSLEEEFSVLEVRDALLSCDGNKSPGPNGFNLNFIKAHWEVIEDDFMGFMNEFH